MAGSNQRYLAYVESSRIYFYGVQMDQAYPIEIPSTAVRDIEVLNRDQIYTLIETFLTQNGITGGSIVMVLAPSLLFEKQIVQDLSDEKRRAAAIKEYIDNVPFEQPAYVSYPVETGIGVIATNEELFVAVKKAFERKNLSVVYVLPVRAFGELQIQPQVGPDPQTGSYLLQNADQVKQFAFHVTVHEEPEGSPGPSSSKKKAPAKHSKKLPIYLSVFGFLLLVLVVMIVVTNQPPASQPVSTTANAEAPAAADNQLPPPAAAIDKTVAIQVKAPAAQKSQADEMKLALDAAGYTAVTVVEGPAAEQTSLLLDSSKIPAATQAALAEDIRTHVGDLTVSQVEGAEVAAQLVIGRPQ